MTVIIVARYNILLLPTIQFKTIIIINVTNVICSKYEQTLQVKVSSQSSDEGPSESLCTIKFMVFHLELQHKYIG